MDTIGTAYQAEVHGTKIVWGEMGTGPPLILIHGFQDSHRTWRRVAVDLSKHFRLLMIDLPGHGLSGRPDAPYTLSWYAKTILAWMDALGIERAHICGHSFGGGIAQWMILEAAERIERMALVAPGGLGRRVGMGMRYAAFPVLGPRITPLAIRYGMPVWLRLGSHIFGHIERDEAKRAIQMSRIPGTDRAFKRSLEGVIDFSGQHLQVAHHVESVETLPPTALFWGEHDPILPVEQGRSAVQRSTGITLTTYPCGHFPHLDRPELFSSDLRSFLEETDRVAVRVPAEVDSPDWIQRVLRKRRKRKGRG